MTPFLAKANPASKGEPAYITVRAEQSGICLRCYGRFPSGTLIRYDHGEGPVHPMCVR